MNRKLMPLMLPIELCQSLSAAPPNSALRCLLLQPVSAPKLFEKSKLCNTDLSNATTTTRLFSHAFNNATYKYAFYMLL